MTHRLVEGDLCFDFDQEWTCAIAWDRHPAYREGMARVDGGRSVDFIGIHDRKGISFIEVKDYRFHRGGRRTNEEEPWVEFEKKVRSTVASLVGAYRARRYADACNPIMKALVDHRPLRLVFWLEEPAHSRIGETTAEERRRAGASFQMQKFKNRIKWLDARVIQTSSTKDYEEVLPGLRVISLPNALPARADLVLAMLKERGIEVPQAVQRRLETWSDPSHPSPAKGKELIDACLRRVPYVTSAQQLIDEAGKALSGKAFS